MASGQWKFQRMALAVFGLMVSNVVAATTPEGPSCPPLIEGRDLPEIMQTKGESALRATQFEILPQGQFVVTDINAMEVKEAKDEWQPQPTTFWQRLFPRRTRQKAREQTQNRPVVKNDFVTHPLNLLVAKPLKIKSGDDIGTHREGLRERWPQELRRTPILPNSFRSQYSEIGGAWPFVFKELLLSKARMHHGHLLHYISHNGSADHQIQNPLSVHNSVGHFNGAVYDTDGNGGRWQSVADKDSPVQVSHWTLRQKRSGMADSNRVRAHEDLKRYLHRLKLDELVVFLGEEEIASIEKVFIDNVEFYRVHMKNSSKPRYFCAFKANQGGGRLDPSEWFRGEDLMISNGSTRFWRPSPYTQEPPPKAIFAARFTTEESAVYSAEDSPDSPVFASPMDLLDAKTGDHLFLPFHDPRSPERARQVLADTPDALLSDALKHFKGQMQKSGEAPLATWDFPLRFYKDDSGWSTADQVVDYVPRSYLNGLLLSEETEPLIREEVQQVWPKEAATRSVRLLKLSLQRKEKPLVTAVGVEVVSEVEESPLKDRLSSTPLGEYLYKNMSREIEAYCRSFQLLCDQLKGERIYTVDVSGVPIYLLPINIKGKLNFLTLNFFAPPKTDLVDSITPKSWVGLLTDHEPRILLDFYPGKELVTNQGLRINWDEGFGISIDADTDPIDLSISSAQISRFVRELDQWKDAVYQLSLDPTSLQDFEQTQKLLLGPVVDVNPLMAGFFAPFWMEQYISSGISDDPEELHQALRAAQEYLELSEAFLAHYVQTASAVSALIRQEIVPVVVEGKEPRGTPNPTKIQNYLFLRGKDTVILREFNDQLEGQLDPVTGNLLDHLKVAYDLPTHPDMGVWAPNMAETVRTASEVGAHALEAVREQRARLNSVVDATRYAEAAFLLHQDQEGARRVYTKLYDAYLLIFDR